MLGHLGLVDPRIDGLQLPHSNPEDPSNPHSPTVPFSMTDALDGGPFDPPHGFDQIVYQMYGYNKPENVTAPVTMNGFYQIGKSSPFVMSAHNATNLPVLSFLAQEYAVFDRWFAQPTPTNPNREYLMSGTSHGAIDNNFPAAKFPQETYFAFLERHSRSWSIYYSDDTWMVPAFQDLQTPTRLARVQQMPKFFEALAAGTLADYTLIQPRMASSATGLSNWQHPDNSVAAGEALIRDIVVALQASSHWNDTLLFITYDEHGGFADHVPSPVVGVPAPDAELAPNGFAFDRLGVRIPAVAVSPWIARGTVVHEPSGPTPTSQYDATSVIATVNAIFGINENMTQRVAWSGRFDSLVDGSSGLRPDTPVVPQPLPVPPATAALEMRMPLNDHHLNSIHVLCRDTHAAHAVCAGHAGAKAFADSLAAPPRPDAALLAKEFSSVDPRAVARLTQQDFQAICATMWELYVQGVEDAAAAAEAAAA